METPNTNWMDYDPGDLYCQCEDPMEMIDGTCARCLRHVDGVIIEVDDDERDEDIAPGDYGYYS